MTDVFGEARKILRDAAIDLSSGVGSPIDVVAVCKKLGLGLRVEAARSADHGGSLRRSARGSEVIVARKSTARSPFSPRERFTIAHEIAHHYLATEGIPGPTSRSEYWTLERLCNEFAARLLILPALNDLDVVEPQTAMDLYRLVNAVCLQALVSPQAAARSVVPLLTTPVLVGRLIRDLKKSSDRVGVVDWLTSNTKEWSSRYKSGTAIRVDDELAQATLSMRFLEVGEGIPLQIDGATESLLRRRSERTAALAALVKSD